VLDKYIRSNLVNFKNTTGMTNLMIINIYFCTKKRRQSIDPVIFISGFSLW